MKKSTKQPGRDNLTGVSAFIHRPPIQADYPLLKHEEKAIARQASIARGWLRAFREVQP
jgi:hypothetical protein